MNFKNILRNGILSGSLLLSACANTNDSLENKSKFYFSGGGNIGSENIDYDVEVGPLVQTTSVHKDDLHLGMHGATAADLSGEEEGKGNFKIGGHISYGTENVRLRIGGDVRFNEFADGGGDNFRSGLHDWRQQKSDHRLLGMQLLFFLNSLQEK